MELFKDYHTGITALHALGSIPTKECAIIAYEVQRMARLFPMALLADRGGASDQERANKVNYGSRNGPTFEWLVKNDRRKGQSDEAIYRKIMASPPSSHFLSKLSSGFSRASAKFLDKLHAITPQVYENGLTPLERACCKGSAEVIDWLAASGVNIEEEGRTPLIWACQLENVDVEVVEKLLAAGRETVDGEGRTPLMLACQIGNVEVVEKLIAAGSKIDAINKNGFTALEIAMHNPIFIGTPVMLKLEKLDNGLTQEIMLCLELAHRFGIEGTMNVLGKEIKLEGWTAKMAQTVLSNKVHSYYTSLLNSIGPDFTPLASSSSDSSLWMRTYNSLSQTTQDTIKDKLSQEKLEEILNETEQAIAESRPKSLEHVLDRMAAGKPIGLLLEIIVDEEGHAIGFACLKVGDTWKVACCNKGWGCGSKPGILVSTTMDSLDLKKFYPQMTQDIYLDEFERNFLLAQIYIAQKSKNFVFLQRPHTGF